MVKVMGSILIAGLIFSSQVYASTLAYVPEKLNKKSAQILVVIHGCLQTPESMALGTGWNQVADQNNLVILYPKVPAGSHPLDCWSWYLPENQNRKSGQLKFLKDQVSEWKRRLEISKAPVMVVGLSSGGAIAAGLLACFPNDFAAGAIHSGPSYGLASTVEEGEKIITLGPEENLKVSRECNSSQFKKPIIVVQGKADTKVNPKNVKRLVSDFLSHAVAKNAESREAGGVKYSVEDYTVDGKLVGRVVLIEGLGHAWAGSTQNLPHASILGPKGKAPTVIPFFTDIGPSSTNLILDFFSSVSGPK